MSQGTRVSSAAAYIVPALRRKNLDILVNTRVTKTFPTGRINGVPIMRGVQLAQSEDGQYIVSSVYENACLKSEGPSYSFKAKREVILAAGATNTPQIRVYLLFISMSV